MRNAQSEEAYKKAAAAFKSVPGFKDADALAGQCLEKAEACRKDAIYDSARKEMFRHDIRYYEKCITQFRTISGWKDADEQIEICQRKIEEIRIAAEKAKKKRKKIFIIAASIVAACTVFIILLTTVIIPTAKKNAFIEKYGQEVYNTFGLVEKGKTIKFGAYEQDNDVTNGKEEIEWTVLNVEDNKALVISKYALDCQQYNSSDTAVTWETCTLRKWLNDSFLNTAFSSKHQELIPSVSVPADKNPKNSTDPGNSTNDKVFLLSITEVEKYFLTEKSRKCVPTAYAKSQGAWTSNSHKTASGKATCRWWLRSPGYIRSTAASVNYGGSFSDLGFVDDDHVCVRPALWINLDS